MVKEIPIKTAAYILLIIAAVSILGTGLILTKGRLFPIITGLATGDVTITVSQDTTVSMVTATVAFGNLALAESNYTMNGTTRTAESKAATTHPEPFVIINDGNVWINVSAEGTDLWTATGFGNPTGNFKANSSVYDALALNGTCVSGDATCINSTSGSYNISWTSVASSGEDADDQLIVAGLGFDNTSTSNSDRADININITVPNPESQGAKSSTITFTGSAY